MLLIDRHYNSLKPYREGYFNLYAVRKNNTCAVRYVEIVGNQLLLRPHNCLSPVEVIPVADRKDHLRRHVPRRTKVVDHPFRNRPKLASKPGHHLP